jgi:hypothetical protein
MTGLDKPSQFASRVVRGVPGNCFELIAGKYRIRVISSQLGTNEPRSLAFSIGRLETGAANMDRNLVAMHIDNELLGHPSTPSKGYDNLDGLLFLIARTIIHRAASWLVGEDLKPLRLALTCTLLRGPDGWYPCPPNYTSYVY